MRQIALIFCIVILTCSFTNKSNIKTNNQLMNSHAEKTIKDLDKKESVGRYVYSTDLETVLSSVFLKAIKVFPDDSASLYRFYYIWNSTKDTCKLEKQIKRLEALTSNESIDRYNKVAKNLKPLLIRIVKANSANKSQADSLEILYSEYDYFSGEALFSQLLTEDDNYNLVWRSFQIMTKESQNDTCYISTLISLNDQISTNVELAEAMPSFIAKAIQNNPIGFLEMYNKRKGDQRTNFSKYISEYEEPDIKLIEIFTDISEKSKNGNYRNLATDLLQRINN